MGLGSENTDTPESTMSRGDRRDWSESTTGPTRAAWLCERARERDRDREWEPDRDRALDLERCFVCRLEPGRSCRSWPDRDRLERPVREDSRGSTAPQVLESWLEPWLDVVLDVVAVLATLDMMLEPVPWEPLSCV